MSPPDFAGGIAAKAKVHGYLLSLLHPVGQSKARFFYQVGFTQGNWHLLAEALINLACVNEVVKVAPAILVSSTLLTAYSTLHQI